jgi:hypothetical protein
MKQHPPQTLLLRIRAETLRLNLKRAHSSFRDLPSLSGQFADIEQCLSTMHERALDLSAKVGELRQQALRQVVPAKEAVKDAQDRLENIVDDLGIAKAKLAELGRKSFLIQIRTEGESTWESLSTRAGVLQADVEAIENDLSNPNAWNALAKAEAEANDLVFNESIELLGGIAMRDARLDADICDLAEALIRSIRGSGNYPSVIPGGISTMMMKIQRFIRLRYPEWTIWALPSVAHELWRVSAREQFDDLLARSLGSAGSMEDPTMQQCISDAFATYIMGPAYALAAITLLFDPTRAQDDLRVHATVSMLRHMDDAKPDAFSESYRTVADDLESAWQAAKQQTGVTIDPSKARVVEAAVAALFKQLYTFGYSYFDVAEWKSLRTWAEKLRDGAVDTIEILPEHDLRHALNAAWLARLDSTRTDDISERVNRLADLVKVELAKVELAKRRSDRVRGELRGVR